MSIVTPYNKNIRYNNIIVFKKVIKPLVIHSSRIMCDKVITIITWTHNQQRFLYLLQ